MGLGQAGSLSTVAGRGRRPARRLAVELGLGLAFAAVVAVAGRPAHASEGGVSFYPLGIGVPDSAIMPPLEGVYYVNEPYYYRGTANASKEFEIGGHVVAGVTANIFADFNFVEWVPTTNVAGGTLALGAAVIPGHVGVDVDVIIQGPQGRELDLSPSSTSTVMGDPILSAELGWKWGDQHLAFTQWLNVPAGQYQQNSLSNLAFHAWIGDSSLGYTWQDDKSGWQASAKAGFTFNGINQFTNYRSGIASHYEASIEKILSPKLSIGAQAYYYWQLTADGGSGDRIGSFEGRVVGVGGTLAYNFKFANRPSQLRFRGMTELDAKNRLEGHSAWIVWSFPLSMKMPPTPPGAAPHGW